MDYDQTAAKQQAYASDKIGRPFPRPSTSALCTVLETLHDNKYRIVWLEKEVERLRVKADAFDALLSITKTGLHYGNDCAVASPSPYYRIDRAIEDLQNHLNEYGGAIYTGAECGHAMSDTVDTPSSFYEGVEAMNEDVEAMNEDVQDEDVPEVPRPSFFHGVDVSTGDDQTVIVEMFRISAEDVQKMQDHMNRTHADFKPAPLTDEEISARLKAIEKSMREKTVGDSDGDDGA